MNYRIALLTGIFSTLALTSSLLGCSGPEDNDPMGSGGLVGTGGTGTGGAGTGGGGVGTGGISSGGGVGTGGVATGGAQGTGGGVGTGGAGTGGGVATGGTGGGMGTGGGLMCPDPNADSGLEPTFANIKLMMFSDANPSATCAASDCHGESDIHPEKLVLQDEAGLLDRMKTHVAHRCNDLLVVQPGEPQNSALVLALKGECTDAEGKALPRMPAGCREADCNCFYPSWMKLIEDWIAAGAPDN